MFRPDSFNSKISAPGNSPDINNNGKLLHEFMENEDLFLLNGGIWNTVTNQEIRSDFQWTYMKFRGEELHHSILDLVMLDKSLCGHISSFEIVVDDVALISSDHSPIVWSLAMNLVNETETKNNEMYMKTNWKSFKQVANVLLDKRTPSSLQSVQEQAQHLHKLLTDAAGISSVQKRRISRKVSFKQRNRLPAGMVSDIKERKQVMHNVRVQLDLGDEGDGSLSSLRLRIKQLDILISLHEMKLQDTRKSKLRKLCRKDKPKSARIFWRYLNGDKGERPQLPVVLTEQGVLSTSEDDRKRMLDLHFQSKFASVPEGTAKPQVNVDNKIFAETSKKFTDEDGSEMMREFILDELKLAISKLTTDSAPGLDKISNKMLKSIEEEVVLFILDPFL